MSTRLPGGVVHRAPDDLYLGTAVNSSLIRFPPGPPARIVGNLATLSSRRFRSSWRFGSCEGRSGGWCASGARPTASDSTLRFSRWRHWWLAARGITRRQDPKRWPNPVRLENRIRLVTCGSSGSSGCQAARAYSLIRPPGTGFRWIRPRSRSVTVRWPPSCSPSGTRWAMPWCGRAVLQCAWYSASTAQMALPEDQHAVQETPGARCRRGARRSRSSAAPGRRCAGSWCRRPGKRRRTR